MIHWQLISLFFGWWFSSSQTVNLLMGKVVFPHTFRRTSRGRVRDLVSTCKDWWILGISPYFDAVVVDLPDFGSFLLWKTWTTWSSGPGSWNSSATSSTIGLWSDRFNTKHEPSKPSGNDSQCAIGNGNFQWVTIPMVHFSARNVWLPEGKRDFEKLAGSFHRWFSCQNTWHFWSLKQDACGENTGHVELCCAS